MKNTGSRVSRRLRGGAPNALKSGQQVTPTLKIGATWMPKPLESIEVFCCRHWLREEDLFGVQQGFDCAGWKNRGGFGAGRCGGCGIGKGFGFPGQAAAARRKGRLAVGGARSEAGAGM